MLPTAPVYNCLTVQLFSLTKEWESRWKVRVAIGYAWHLSDRRKEETRDLLFNEKSKFLGVISREQYT